MRPQHAEHSQNAQTDDDRSEMQEEYEPPKRRKDRKRAKIAPKNASDVVKDKAINKRSIVRRVGKLRNLPDMPLDILFEIFSSLQPLDLLRLTRTTKALRGMLMQRSARLIWKGTLINIEGLPECPPDLTEPQYVRLLFDPSCSFCDATVKTIYWELRVRCCKRCKATHLIRAHDMYSTCILRSFMTSKWEDWCEQALPGQLLDSRSWFRKDNIIDLELEIKNTKDDLNTLLERKRAMKANIIEHADRCKLWHAAQLQSRTNELDAARERRKAAIRQRLTDAGWAETLNNMDHKEDQEFRHHPLVRQPKDLTDKIWDNIRDTLAAYLQEVRLTHLEQYRVAQVKKRVTAVHRVRQMFLENHPQGMIVPCLADLCFMKEFRALLDLPAEVGATSDMFSEAAKSSQKCAPGGEGRRRRSLQRFYPLSMLQMSQTRPMNV